MKRYLLLIITASLTLPSMGQDVRKWNLQECIEHAIEHNIDIKQQKDNLEGKKIDLNTSKNSWLPNLNAGIGQSFDFGRSPSKTGVIVDQNSRSTSASVQLNMPLFDGMQIPNDIASKKLDLKAAMASLEKAKESLSINIASYYLQVLYTNELLDVARLQVALTNEQVERTELLVQVGKVSESQLYDIKAQLASDQVSLTEAQNNRVLALLDLVQSLELERAEKEFDVVVPLIDDVIAQFMSGIIPPDDIYNNAVAIKPQVKEQEYLLDSQKKKLKIAQAGYYPTLNLNASYSNGYYHYSKAENISFKDQLDQNSRKTIGFNLSIPIFNRFQVRNSVRSARVGIHTQELMIENSKKVLYKEIQQAYYNAIAAQEKYIASNKSVDATKEAFKYAEERYSAGKSTVFEYNESKTKYSRSLSEQAQAKYRYIFDVKILDFYNGVPLEL